MNTRYSEVKCTFFDEGVWYVDAWETDNDENSTVVARINENTFQVEYTPLGFPVEKDEYVKLIVAEKLSELTAFYIRNCI